MAQYSRATLTDAGVQIARQMMDDDTITMTFTGIASGDGNYSTGEDIAARTALKNQIQFFPLSSKKVTSDNVLHLKYIISNVNPDDTPLTVGYYVREIGIYAQVDSEPAVLYAIAIADSATADYLPEYDSLQPSTITMDWFLTVGNAENVSIAASPSAYALASDLAATNAVVVTKLTASGGDAADAIIGSATASTAEYPVPAANDTFKVILGKIIKFCADIVKTFTGATSGAAGKKGLVPQPAAGDQNDYLRGDSTWQTPVNNALATAAGSVLDARMGKTLQDQITSLNDSLDNYTDSGRFTFRRWYLQNAGSMTLTFSGGSQGIFFLGGANGARTSIVNVYCSSTGSFSIVDFINPPSKAYSLTSTTNYILTLTTSQAGVTFAYIKMGGAVPTES